MWICHHHHVATITTNRPERYNSLNYEAYRLLTEYFAQADADPQVRAIIWTGNGRGFCTGDDVKELLGEGADELARRIASGASSPRRQSPFRSTIRAPRVSISRALRSSGSATRTASLGSLVGFPA